MKIIIAFFLFSLILTQGNTQANLVEFNKNVAYIEIAGVGGYGSINYERIIPLNNKFSMSGRIGLSTINLRDFTTRFNPDLIIPIGLNAFYGLNHKIHLGIGQVFSNTVNSNSKGEVIRHSSFHSFLSIGYRFRKQNSRLLLGINYTPFLEFQNTIRHWGGITIGYSF